MGDAPNGRLLQGQHPDPLDPALPRPDPHPWPERRRRAWTGAEIRLYRQALTLDGDGDERAGVLDDLSTYFGIGREQAVERCINWEQWSVQEWHAKPRDTREALAEFYQKLQSWAFDVLWYAYLQAEGYCYPVSVAIAQTLPDCAPGSQHLDFGSGAGVTSQLFSALGYQTDLANVSSSLLAFAKYRLDRRSVDAAYIDLNEQTPGRQRYDVITAIDTLVHVPCVTETAALLHRALKPGGLLFANFDVRPATPENAWHLYDDDLPLRWHLQRTGFEPEETLDGMITRYRRIEPSGITYHLRGARDRVLLRSPLRPGYRSVRHSLAGALRRRG